MLQGSPMKKLTLSMDPRDIRAARRIADAHRTSISDLFRRLIRAMSPAPATETTRRSSGGTSDGGSEGPLPPATERLSGIIAAPADRSDRELIEEAILEEHGERHGDRHTSRRRDRR